MSETGGQGPMMSTFTTLTLTPMGR